MKAQFHALVIIWVLSCSTTVLSAQSARSPASEWLGHDAAPALSAGDAVKITVWRQTELSGEFDIAADGTIRHPLLREVRVAGVPVTSVEELVRAYLQRLEANPQFVVEPLFRVSVGGEVRSPNLYSFAPEITVAQAVARAGGPTERGRLDHVKLLRNGRALVLDLTRPDLQLAELTVHSGDQIMVGRRRNILREYVTPVASMTAAVASIVSAYIRFTR